MQADGSFGALLLFATGSSGALEGLQTGILKCQISRIWHFKGNWL